MTRIGLVLLVQLLWLGQFAVASPPPAKEWSILWVIDNSASFMAQREIIKKYLPTFSSKLKAAGVTSFKMAVTNTDYFCQEGNLIALGGTKVVSGESSDGIDQFISMIDLLEDTSTSFWEQGLESAYQAIEKEGNFFIRPDVPLAVIYVTDENDYSCEKNCSGVEPEHNPDWRSFSVERYVAQFKSMANTGNIKVHPFPIIGLPSGTCQVASYGERYLGVMNSMNTGHAFSVCPGDLVKSLDSVATQMGSGTPPATAPIWTANPIELTATVGTPIHHRLSMYVENSPKSAGYSKLSGPAWATVSGDGVLLGTPNKFDLGDNAIAVRVCNQLFVCAETVVRVVVTHSNQPPAWTSPTIPLPPARVGEAFSVDISPYVVDPDGDVLKFKAISIPAWLSLTAHGVLTGVPAAVDVGKFAAQVVVTDGMGSSAMARSIGTVVAQ